MLGGVIVYGVMSGEQRLFEQELVRRQRLQEALRSVNAKSTRGGGGISKLAVSIRNFVRMGSSTEQAAASA